MSDYHYTVELETYDEENFCNKTDILLFADSLDEARKFFEDFECPDDAQLMLIESRLVDSK